MGQFSWITCDSNKQVVDGKRQEVYALVPAEFGGGHITEECYDGYGHFGKYDIYDLVADWNKDTVTKDNFRKPQRNHYSADPDGENAYQRACEHFAYEWERSEDFRVLSDEEMKKKYGQDYKRLIGIDIACYDEQNEKLKYPIKIAEYKFSEYENSKPSPRDPNQGWEEDEEEDDQFLFDEEWEEY